jgi:hypothetical protein
VRPSTSYPTSVTTALFAGAGVCSAARGPSIRRRWARRGPIASDDRRGGPQHSTSGKESGRVVPLDRPSTRLQTGQASGAGHGLEPYANYTVRLLRWLPHLCPITDELGQDQRGDRLPDGLRGLALRLRDVVNQVAPAGGGRYPVLQVTRPVQLVRRPPHTLPAMGSTAFHVAWSKATPSSARYFPLSDPLPGEEPPPSTSYEQPRDGSLGHCIALESWGGLWPPRGTAPRPRDRRSGRRPHVRV